ncbi:ankyrin repeat protein, partial [Absidia repens]
LMFASLRGHLDCVKALIEYGHAGIHLVDKYARSPLHLACIEGHYQVAKYLLMQGLETNAHDSSSNTPAHYAAAFGHLDIVKLLVEFGGADPSSNNVWRATPCSVANLKGHIAIVQYLLSLPDGNVNVDFKDEDGYTMLHRA